MKKKLEEMTRTFGFQTKNVFSFVCLAGEHKQHAQCVAELEQLAAINWPLLLKMPKVDFLILKGGTLPISREDKHV